MIECGVSILVRARFDVRDQRQADFEQVVLALGEWARSNPRVTAFAEIPELSAPSRPGA